jgi:hypothetical protein
MPSIALTAGVVIFGLGAILGLLSAIRTLQKSRSWSNYRLRRRFLSEARVALVLAVLSGAVAVALLVLSQSGRPRLFPIPALPGSILSRVFATRTPTARSSPASSPTATPSPTTAPVVVPSAAFPMTAEPTSTPSMPIAVEAMIQGTETPAAEVEVGRLRFSTTINGFTLIAPAESFPNPIKQMYAVFAYQPSDQGVAWTALWYQERELKYVDTTSWTSSPPGIGVAHWTRKTVEWEPGDYEVQIFVGTAWKATGSFSLTGEPPTFTPEATATGTARATATRMLTATPTGTPSPTTSPVPSPTATQTPLPVKASVSFTNTQPRGGRTPPFNEPVARQVSGSGSPIDGVLLEYFNGPDAAEKARGLIGLYNGFTGYRRAELVNGMLGIYLEGNCQPNGTSYSIAQPLIDTLKQFPGVRFVKIYDEYDHTGDPLSNADSWPTCLDVVFTSTATARPTMTSTATASAIPTDVRIPTKTAGPTATSTPVPPPAATATSSPTASVTERPTTTSTPVPPPTATATASPTASATASATATSLPAATPKPETETPAPTETPAQPAPSIIDAIFTFFRQLFGGR